MRHWGHFPRLRAVELDKVSDTKQSSHTHTHTHTHRQKQIYTNPVVTCEIKLFRNNFGVLFHAYPRRKLFQPLGLFPNYFSDTEHVGKYSRPAISLRNDIEIFSGNYYFRRTSTKAEIILKELCFTCNHSIGYGCHWCLETWHLKWL